MNYIRIVSAILMLVVFLKATSIEMTGVTQYSLTKRGVSYSISSKKRVINYSEKKIDIFRILKNKKEYVSNMSYYLNGTFKTKITTINFKKAFWLEGALYLEKCKGNLPKYGVFSALEIKIKKNIYYFKTIKYKKDKKLYIKHNLVLKI